MWLHFFELCLAPGCVGIESMEKGRISRNTSPRKEETTDHTDHTDGKMQRTWTLLAFMILCPSILLNSPPRPSYRCDPCDPCDPWLHFFELCLAPGCVGIESMEKGRISRNTSPRKEETTDHTDHTDGKMQRTWTLLAFMILCPMILLNSTPR